MKHNIIPIFFSVDEGYIPYLAVALRSLFDNASPEYHYKVYVLSQNVSERVQAQIEEMSEPGKEIFFRPMQEHMEEITDRASNRLRCDYFTLTIYYRLFIPVMFPEYDKGIYIDSDVVVEGDISKLYEKELGSNLIGACNDESVLDIPELRYYIERGVGIPGREYINSGILLMNLKLLRKARIDQHFLRLLTTYHFDTIAPDQDYINVLCNGRIHYLNKGWDAMPKEGEKEVENPYIVHYNLFSKPWCYDGVPYETYFWKYAEKTVYLEKMKHDKAHYSEEQKQSDAGCLKQLLAYGKQIGNADENFRTVFESGKEKRLSWYLETEVL